ncbi:MAG: c-type cytochrome [Photobacterium frigidiphilum]|uniref:c-type cytochrome n=1 Tax=Photobacterium frigidiphilum TaxID=264736 RepID=UPI003003215C
MTHIANMSPAVFVSNVFLVSLFFANLFFPANARAELLDGAMLYKKYQCHICHGERGGHPARSGYPVIAGQDRDYLTRQILDIRDGVRDNGQAGVMRPLIKLINDKEVEVIAVYINSMNCD